jgi:hypothetical protein
VRGRKSFSESEGWEELRKAARWSRRASALSAARSISLYRASDIELLGYVRFWRKARPKFEILEGRLATRLCLFDRSDFGRAEGGCNSSLAPRF